MAREQKTRQIASVEANGHCYSIVRDFSASVNPYRVYRRWWDARKDGYGLGEHKKCVARYADLRSALLSVADLDCWKGVE